MNQFFILFAFLLLSSMELGMELPLYAQPQLQYFSNIIHWKETRFSGGATYQKLQIMSPAESKNTHIAHVLTIPLGSYYLIPQKAQHSFSGLQPLLEMGNDIAQHSFVIGGINTNFWSKFLNAPMNPTIVDGQIIQFRRYKQWSSVFLTDKLPQEIFLDTFQLTSTIKISEKIILRVDGMNYRPDSTGVIVYNQYAGNSIPFLTINSYRDINKTVLKEVRRIRADNQLTRVLSGDSTEIITSDTTLFKQLRESLEKKERFHSMEYSMPRIAVRFLQTPVLNREISCIVTDIRQSGEGGNMVIPQHGCVISLGQDTPVLPLPYFGDTISIAFATNLNGEYPFSHAIGGTPRIVRNGVAEHEAEVEGSTARRFIRGKLARSAIGWNEGKDTVFLVAIDGSNTTEETYGMNLNDLAHFMQYLGAYEAMNLDGGGSTSMVVRKQHDTSSRDFAQESSLENVIRFQGRENTRSISVGLFVVRR